MAAGGAGSGVGGVGLASGGRGGSRAPHRGGHNGGGRPLGGLDPYAALRDPLHMI